MIYFLTLHTHNYEEVIDSESFKTVAGELTSGDFPKRLGELFAEFVHSKSKM